MRRARCVIVAAMALMLSAEAARAAPPEIAEALPGATQVGEASYSFLAWTVFDAGLWTSGGAFAWERPFALSLTYRRAFSARALTEQTLTEMQERGAGNAQSLAPLRQQLVTCFANVASGDRITAVSLGPHRAVIYYNGVLRCSLERPGLRRDFFGIWLDAQGDARAFSDRLRGAL